MDNTDPFASNQAAFEKNENRNVFVMMRYSSETPFAEIEEVIKETLQRYGLRAVLARDVAFHQELWNNVRFCMNHCRYAIVVFDRIQEPEFNPNVALELGYMLALRRPCLILKETSLPRLHTDIISHLYTPFKSHNVKESLGPAIEGWLHRLGHIKSAETITDESPIEANIERTRLITAELRKMSESALEQSGRIIRQAASLSSLAISQHEVSEYENDERLRTLLILERSSVESLLKAGASVRLIICPDIQVSRVRLGLVAPRFVPANVLSRYEQIITIIKQYIDRPNLQIAYTHRLVHENLLIIGENRAFVGRKRVMETGFPHTTVIYDPAIISEEIHGFDLQFHDLTSAILGIETVNIEDYSSRALKTKVLEKLKESQKEIRRWLNKHSSKSASSSDTKGAMA